MSLLTPQQAAEILQVTVPTIYHWIRAGTLRGTKIGGVWRIRLADVDLLVNHGNRDRTAFLTTSEREG